VRKTGAPPAANCVLGFHRRRSWDDGVGQFLVFLPCGGKACNML
jgi:hypothetical protein